MPSLTDIAASSQTVAGVSVFGVSAKGVAIIFERFPVFRKLFTGQAVDFTPDMITTLAPDALATVLACGTGSPGDKDAEAAAEKLPVHVQAEMLEAIVKLTMPNGVGPFVEMIGRLAATIGVNGISDVPEVADGSKAPDTNSPKPSNT